MISPSRSTDFYQKNIFTYLFFLSGISGLIYQVVWMRMLIRVFGISLFAISTVVAVFMSGLAIGSWGAGKVFFRRRISLQQYALLEIAIGVSAIIASIVMNHLSSFYAFFASHFYSAGPKPAFFMLGGIRFLFAFAALIIPTILMGATLPLLGQYLTSHNRNVGGNLALLYGANTMGAVVGVLLTGFLTLAVWGESRSIAIGVVINLSVAILAFVIQKFSPIDKSEIVDKSTLLRPDHSPFFFLVVGFMTGFCSLSLEVLWSRLSIFLVGSSVYAFSAVLSVYLLGIGFGSLAAKRWVDSLKYPIRVLGSLQIGIAVTALVGLYAFWGLGAISSNTRFLYSPLYSGKDLLWFFGASSLILFVSTFIMGISFPILGRIVSEGREEFAESIGTLYAWNTIGGVVGCLLTGYFLIPKLGTQVSFCLISCLCLLIGAMIALRENQYRKKIFLVLSTICLAFLIAIPTKNIIIDILSRRLVNYTAPSQIVFQREESAGILTGVETSQGKLLLINGIITSGNGIPGHVMAHLPLLLHSSPKIAAVICFGVGNTFRAAIDHIGNVDGIELVPGVVQSFKYFYPNSDTYLKSPGAKIFIEDGRQHLSMINKRYDVIIVDASPPIFSAGTVNLYAKNFLEICQERLAPDGIMCLWVPTPCFEDDFWQIAKGFSQVYPHLFVWANTKMSGIILMGSKSDLHASFLKVGERIKNRTLGESASWLTENFLNDAVILYDDEIRMYASKFETITDDKPLTEFPLWKFLNGKKFWTSNKFLIQPHDR